MEYIKFINKIIILFTIAIILLLALNLFYTDVVLKEKDLYRKHVEYVEYKKNYNIRVLAFGDSIPTNDFNPIYIKDSFNIATPGENFEQTYYKVKWVIENELEVDIFVIEYNRHLFNYYRVVPYYDQNYWSNFMSYEELSLVTNISKFNLFFTVSIPVIGKGQEIYRFFFSKRPYVKIENGWYNYTDTFPDLQKNNTVANGKRRAFNQFRMYPSVRQNDLSNIFLNTLTMLNNNNKKIVLVVYPLIDEYLKPLERDVNITEEYKKYDEMILNNFNNIIILDYREMLRYNQTLFVHSDHLNRDGAEILSKQLYEDIKHLYL